MFRFLCFISIITFPVLAMAQEIAAPAAAMDSDQAAINALMQSLGGQGGLTSLGVVAVIVQLLLKFMDTGIFSRLFSEKIQNLKLPMVSILTVLFGTVVLMKQSHLSLGAGMIHSSMLSAGMVFFHQWFKFLKPAAKPSAPAPQ